MNIDFGDILALLGVLLGGTGLASIFQYKNDARAHELKNREQDRVDFEAINKNLSDSYKETLVELNRMEEKYAELAEKYNELAKRLDEKNEEIERLNIRISELEKENKHD